MSSHVILCFKIILRKWMENMKLVELWALNLIGFFRFISKHYWFSNQKRQRLLKKLTLNQKSYWNFDKREVKEIQFKSLHILQTTFIMWKSIYGTKCIEEFVRILVWILQLEHAVQLRRNIALSSQSCENPLNQNF